MALSLTLHKNQLHQGRQITSVARFFRQIWLFFIWLAGKFGVWWLADFLAIFAIFWRKLCRIFVQDLDQCLVHKKLIKINLIWPPNSFFRLCRLFAPVPAVSVQWKPCMISSMLVT